MGEHLPQHCSASSRNHFGPHGEWKIYLATKISTKVASWQPTDKKKEGKNVKNLSILGQIINELTVSQCFLHIHFIYNHTIMKYDMLSYHGWSLEKSSVQQLTTYIFRAMKTKCVFISIFIPKFFDGITHFQDTLHPKASGYKSCILFSYAT